jgi:hypothetical protein
MSYSHGGEEVLDGWLNGPMMNTSKTLSNMACGKMHLDRCIEATYDHLRGVS